MNVFTDDWKALETEDSSEKVSEGLMLHQAFTVQNFNEDKKISCIRWHPTVYGKDLPPRSEQKKRSRQQSLHSTPGHQRHIIPTVL